MPARWRRISGHRRQKAVRESLEAKIGLRAHIPPEVLREDHLTFLSLLVEADPVGHTRDLSLNAEELTMLIHDRAKAQEVVEQVERREKEEKAAAAKKSAEKPKTKTPPAKKPGGQSSLF